MRAIVREARIGGSRIVAAAVPQRPRLQPRLQPGEQDMKWETPTATDLRFGFEITMYIANR